MNSLLRRANELKIGSSILTRRGGTDANAPESPRKAILRDWHVGILASHICHRAVSTVGVWCLIVLVRILFSLPGVLPEKPGFPSGKHYPQGTAKSANA